MEFFLGMAIYWLGFSPKTIYNEHLHKCLTLKNHPEWSLYPNQKFLWLWKNDLINYMKKIQNFKKKVLFLDLGSHELE